MVYTVKEVAELLKLPESTVFEYVRKHIIPSFKIGRHIRIRKQDLEDCIERLMN